MISVNIQWLSFFVSLVITRGLVWFGVVAKDPDCFSNSMIVGVP